MNQFFTRISNQEKILFAKRMAILMRAGIPILDSIRMLTKQTSPAASKIFGAVARDLEHGKSLSSGLAKFKKVFGEFAINIISVGEMSGTLQENLNYLATELEKRQELKRKITGALVYPIFIVIATIAVSSMLTIFIFPKILPVFASLHFDLPFTTKALIFISDVLIHYGFLILLGLILLAAFFTFLFVRVDSFRLAVDKLVLKIPFFGRIVQSYHMANFCRTMGLLLKSQVMIVQAIAVAAATTTNLAYRREIKAIADNVTRGEKISTHLAQHETLFPPLMSQMIMVGEASGSLSDTLLYVAELYENELDMLTKNLSTTIEPILMIVMGVIVGFIAVAIITPIYEVTQHIHP